MSKQQTASEQKTKQRGQQTINHFVKDFILCQSQTCVEPDTILQVISLSQIESSVNKQIEDRTAAEAEVKEEKDGRREYNLRKQMRNQPCKQKKGGRKGKDNANINENELENETANEINEFEAETNKTETKEPELKNSEIVSQSKEQTH